MGGNIQNNPDAKKIQKAIKNANFQNVLNQVANTLNAQINKIEDKKIKNNLKNLVNNGRQQAKQELKKAGLTGNIAKKAQQKFNQNNGQAKVDAFNQIILAQAQAAAAQLE